MHTSTLQLFNAIQVETKQPKTIPAPVLERTIRNGYLLDPSIYPAPELLDAIEKVVGVSGEKANASFHKSWAAVQNTPFEKLVIQQLVHYLTTYGFEALGIYSKDTVYIPSEGLELPAIGDSVPLIVIRALTGEELLERILRLGAGVALAEPTLQNIMEIVGANRYDPAFLVKIKNRELLARLYDFYGLAPSDPQEYLRYLVYRLTKESILVKNDALIEKLKKADSALLDALLEQAPAGLASIFLRFKPLFLALKSASRNKHFFNRLRKDAKKQHQPLPKDYFNSITAQVKGSGLDMALFEQKLSRLSIFRKIRLAYALQYRLHQSDSILYRVRTGRGWATGFSWPEGRESHLQQALERLLAAIANEIQPKVSGKTFYIPEQIHYALPATEKQFTGNFPTGSWVHTPENLVIGIHWVNTARRIDIDLSLLMDDYKIGWDGRYTDGNARILFSGDMTDAPPPQGASELFYIKKAMDERFLLMANYFNFDPNDSVDARILLAQDTPENFDRNYMLNPNHVLFTANVQLTSKQNILGLLGKVDGELRFYFANINLGSSITARGGAHVTQARKYLIHRLIHGFDLALILKMAGASVVAAPALGEYINLAPEALDKTVILDLLTPKDEK